MLDWTEQLASPSTRTRYRTYCPGFQRHQVVLLFGSQGLVARYGNSIIPLEAQQTP